MTDELPTGPVAVKAARAADEKDRTSLGQRRVNLIWEVTQAIIALAVTLATLYASVTLTVRGEPGSAAFLLLSNAFFLVIGFYFGRTNHQRVGGVGPTGSDGEIGR
jgi:hypothetical protein